MAEIKSIEALKNLRLFMKLEDKDNDVKFPYETYEAVDIAIKALEKQIPKKTIPIDYEKYMNTVKNALFLKGAYWCPNCKHVVKCGTYCSDCGQKLEWSDTE